MVHQLGSRIRNLRIESKMTQEMVAQQLDVSRQTIAKWESDKSKPSTNNLIQLASLFGVSLNYLTEQSVKEVDTARKQRFRFFIYSPVIIYTGTCNLYSMGQGDLVLQHICLFITFIMGILMCVGIWNLNADKRMKYAWKLLLFCLANWFLIFMLTPLIGNILTMILAAGIAVLWMKELSYAIEEKYNLKQR